jgi:organic radical activating enzyme
MAMIEEFKASFSAADIIPVKLLQSVDVVKSIRDKRVIPPIHVQFIPTNKCNLNCDFCSCSKVDRKIEMSLESAYNIVEILKLLGTKAVTITGGGDPMMHPYISDILNFFYKEGIKVGMVTNGILLPKLPVTDANKMVWCRISHGDYRPFDFKYSTKLSNYINSTKGVGWAFSYVVGKNPDIEKLSRMIHFAAVHDFTHIRVVADLLHPEDVLMAEVEKALEYHVKITTMPIIFQRREQAEQGSDCFICYLKPLIGADTKVYTCCGAQYAFGNPTRDLPKELRLGSAFDLQKIIEGSAIPFNGSICKRCYYGSYNSTLKTMLLPVQHQEFL